MFFSYTPDITPKFDTIYRIWDNSVTVFFSIQFFVYLFLADLKCSFCLTCVIICSYLLTFVFFAINLCFNSSIIRFIPFFLTPYLAFSSLIFLFPFPPVSPYLSLSSPLISLLKLVISISILLFHHDFFFSPFLSFFNPTSFAT